MKNYKPTAIPLQELLEMISQISEDATFEASYYLKKKVQVPKELRRKKHMADTWYSIHQYLETLNNSR